MFHERPVLGEQAPPGGAAGDGGVVRIEGGVGAGGTDPQHRHQMHAVFDDATQLGVAHDEVVDDVAQPLPLVFLEPEPMGLKQGIGLKGAQTVEVTDGPPLLQVGEDLASTPPQSLVLGNAKACVGIVQHRCVLHRGIAGAHLLHVVGEQRSDSGLGQHHDGGHGPVGATGPQDGLTMNAASRRVVVEGAAAAGAAKAVDDRFVAVDSVNDRAREGPFFVAVEAGLAAVSQLDMTVEMKANAHQQMLALGGDETHLHLTNSDSPDHRHRAKARTQPVDHGGRRIR